MPKVNLSDTERICIAAVLTLGKETLDVAYRLINSDSKSNDEVFHKQALRWWNLPNVKAFANDLRSIRMQAANSEIELEDDADTPITRSFLIKELRLALKATNDPSDRASIAMKLADLSGLKGKQDDDNKDNEQRVFYLPWRSKCKSCKLMQVYMQAMEEEKQTINK